jgi:5-methylcytosine-specific restriction protein A
MPTINLHFIKNYKKKNYNKNNNLDFIYVYNTLRWKKIRLWYLSKHPLCEKCEKENKLTLAIDVHHKIYLSTGRTKEEKQRIGYDINNLEAVCKDCHKHIHKYEYNFK